MSLMSGFIAHTSSDVPNIRKKSMGPATSLSSIICWSMRPKGFRTASVYSLSAYRYKLAPTQPTFICMCLKFTPNSSTIHCQLVKLAGLGVAYVGEALRRICRESASSSVRIACTYPSVPNAASHPVRSPDTPIPICPLTPGAENPAPYCAGYA